jgi:uncharacterized membrane protein
MNKSISVVLMVVGVILLVYGIIATDSFSSEVSQLFTGTPTDKSIWMVIVGATALILGMSGTAFSPKKS